MNKVKEFRALRGLSQRDLAEMVGVTQPTIQRAEAEDPSAKLETYKKIAEALDVALTDLFSERNEQELILINLFRSSSEPEKLRMVQILRAAKDLPS